MDYPSTWLPRPTVSFSPKEAAATARTAMDSGRVRQRQRFTRVVTTIGVSWQLTDEQYAILKGFFEHSLNGGADWFNMELPLGDGFQTYAVRFVGGLSDDHYGALNWNVSATLELEQGGPLTAEVTAALLLVEDLTEFETAAAAFHELVHVTIPAEI
jgi:hypothetical protein